jgi:glycosyltransferase involved in cell wall biosynthesis
MKFTILFRNYDPEHKVCDLANRSIHSVLANSTGHDYEIIVLDRKGIAADFIRGLKQARGEYVVIVANDVIIEDPEWLDKMAVPDRITGWRESHSEFYEGTVDFSAAFCVPKHIAEKIGEFDTGFVGYGYEDDDWFYRARKLGVEFQVVPVKLTHHETATFKAYNEDITGQLKRNREYFYQKHFTPK